MSKQSVVRWLTIAVVLGTFGLSACEDEESNKINQAQACLDKVDDSNPASAVACEKYIKGVNSQQAWVLRCSIDFIEGGLTNSRIIQAFKDLDDTDGANSTKEAYFIANLALSSTAAADDAFESCQKSKVASLIYIASFSRAGAYLNAAGNALGDDIIDANGNIDEAALDAAIDSCANGDATCDLDAIGESIITLESIYCTGANKNSEACEEVNLAIENGGGTPEGVGEILACLLKKPRGAACANL